MGKLYDARRKIEQAVEDRKLDTSRVLGSIGQQSGLLVFLIKPETPDDPAKLERLKRAAAEVLQLTL